MSSTRKQAVGSGRKPDPQTSSSRQDSSRSETRPPTETKVAKPTASPSSISCGTKEKTFLRYLFDTQGKRFNLREYYRLSNVPPTTIRDMKVRLANKGLINNLHADAKLTNLGISFITNYEIEGVEQSRRECRAGRENLSTHYLKYKSTISSKTNFSEVRLSSLGAIKHKTVKLPNLTQHYVYYDGATIIIGPKQIVVRIHDVISDDTEEAHFQGFQKAMSYFEKLDGVGIHAEGVKLEPAHYARVNSYLADFLSDVDGRYFLKLNNGNKFWIDNSTGPKEDETNDADYRERLDQVMSSIQGTNSDFHDLDKLIKVVEGLTLVSANLVQTQVADKFKPEPMADKLIGRADYFG